MGEIAERLSDRVVITDDNPRTEDSAQILKDILDGISNAADVICEADRAAAIRAAAEGSEAGDVILIAGKGHETVQVIGTERIPFDDRQIAIDVFGSENDSGDYQNKEAMRD